MRPTTFAWKVCKLIAALLWMGLRLTVWVALQAFVGLILGGITGRVVSIIMGMLLGNYSQTAAIEFFGACAGVLIGSLFGLIRGIWIVVREVREEILTADEATPQTRLFSTNP